MTAEEEGIRLPLIFVGAEDVPIIFSNLQVVQHQQSEFILTFGQFAPPLLLGSPEEVQERLREAPYVPVKTVARIGMTPDRVLELVEILQTNYNKWHASQQKESA
jgi:hypothetical protein